MKIKAKERFKLKKHAIVRPPPKSFSSCISSHPLRHLLDIDLAKKQHSMYCRTLEELGLELIQLSSDENHPDSCFVEDTAIVFGNKAVITRMAKQSRRGEVDTISEVLAEHKSLKKIKKPGTIEGGDVIHLDDFLISGVSERTNNEGIRQSSDWLGARIDTVQDPDIVHLKSYTTYLGKNIMIMTNRFQNHPIFRNFVQVLVPSDETYAANTLAIDDVVLMSSRHPKTSEIVREVGFEVIQLNMSEFEKCEGALTCLSIIF